MSKYMLGRRQTTWISPQKYNTQWNNSQKIESGQYSLRFDSEVVIWFIVNISNLEQFFSVTSKS